MVRVPGDAMIKLQGLCVLVYVCLYMQRCVCVVCAHAHIRVQVCVVACAYRS